MMMKTLEKKLTEKMEKRMGPLALVLDKVLIETKNQTKILGEIRDALKK